MLKKLLILKQVMELMIASLKDFALNSGVVIKAQIGRSEKKMKAVASTILKERVILF